MNNKCFFLVFLFAGICAAKSIDLVKNSLPKASILLASDATPVERHAAEELAFFVEKITGASLPISEQQMPGLLPVRLGKAALQNGNDFPGAEQIKDDGFIVDASDKGVNLFAKINRGVLYAVYHILRQNGGVYFLYPGDEGTVCPKNRDFSIPVGTEVKNPVFLVRRFNLNGGSGWTPETFDWLLRNGLILYNAPYKTERASKRSDFLDKRGCVISEGGHTMGTLLLGYGGKYRPRMEALLQEEPELFGLVDGKRLPAGNFAGASQPCTSNPAVLERMLQNCITRIQTACADTENMRHFCNDDHTIWCRCENCQKLDSPLENNSFNRRSTRWWHYVNFMAKGLLDSGECPNTSVATLAYQNFRSPPAGIKPDLRVMVGIAPHQRCYLHSLDNPNCSVNADKFRELFEAWHRVGSRSYTFEYHPEMPGATNYLFNEKAWVDDLKYYHSLNMAGYGMVTNAPNGNYKGNTYNRLNRWMSSWQRHWLTGFFSWNIDSDYEEVSEKINKLYYGIAYPVMKEYRQLLTDAVLGANLHMGYGTPNSVLGKCYDRPGVPEKAAELLDKAEQVAAQEPIVLKRIALDREYFQKNWEVAYQQYRLIQQKEYNVALREGAIKIDAILDENAWKNADYLSNFNLFGTKGVMKNASPDTFVRILYDSDNLYFAIEALKAKHGKVMATAKSDGLSALNGSHLELFITPPELEPKYYHLGFSVNGKFFQALTSTGSTRDDSVKINPEYKVNELPDRWILEARLPVSALSLSIVEGVVWRFNVARAALDDSEKMQQSSCSNGVFHGSEVHRSMAFGKTGAILRNGDLEDIIEAKERKSTRSNRKYWEYLSNTVPKFWYFNENNTGSIEMCEDEPASGKWYMKIKGRNAFVGQKISLPGKERAKYKVSAQARGDGEVLLRLLSGGKYYGGEQNLKQLTASEKWTEVSSIIECPSSKNQFFYLRITGEIDIDDARISPVLSDEEEMPNAMKH